MNGDNDWSEQAGQDGSQSTSPVQGSPLGKWTAGLWSCLMMGAVLSPVAENWRAKPGDSFPLSCYPMFTEKREPTCRITYLAGIDAQGNRRQLPYKYAGSGGLNQVRRQIGRVVREAEAENLCASVAKLVARQRQGWETNVVSVQVRTDTYDLAGYFTGTNRLPINEVVRSSCEVKRRPG